MTVQENISLKKYNSFGINVFAKYFAAFNAVDEISELLEFKKLSTIHHIPSAAEGQLSTLILGGGSNLLVSDQGFRGLVIQNKILGIEFFESDEITLIKVGAGVVWDEVVALAVSKGLWGIENLSNIPGSTGAIPVQNVGAYGQEVSETIVAVRHPKPGEKGENLFLQ